MELPYTIIRLLYAFKVSDALAQREIIAMLRYFNMSCQMAACFQPLGEVKVEILEQKEKFFVGTGYPPPISPISAITSWPARASMAGGHNLRGRPEHIGNAYRKWNAIRNGYSRPRFTDSPSPDMGQRGNVSAFLFPICRWKVGVKRTKNTSPASKRSLHATQV